MNGIQNKMRSQERAVSNRSALFIILVKLIIPFQLTETI